MIPDQAKSNRQMELSRPDGFSTRKGLPGTARTRRSFWTTNIFALENAFLYHQPKFE